MKSMLASMLSYLRFAQLQQQLRSFRRLAARNTTHTM